MDRVFAAQPSLALAREREVDEHDAVLLDDADQQDDPDDADHVEGPAKQQQGQQGAEPGRRQGRDDRDRMDHALIENTQNDVHGDERGQDQDRRAAQRTLKCLRAALEAGGDRRRQVHCLHRLLDRRYGIADRRARSEVEAQGYRGELALVVDRDRRDCLRDGGELAQRDFAATRRGGVNPAQRIRPELQARIDLQDHVVLVQRGVDLGDMPLAESVVQERIDDRGVDAEPRGDISVDLDLQNLPSALLVARNAGQFRQTLQLLQDQGRPVIELRAVDVDQCVLVLGLREARADRDVLRGLHVQGHAFDRLQRLAQSGDHLVGVDSSLRLRLEGDEHAPVVFGDGRAAGSDISHRRGHRRILGDDPEDGLLAIFHRLRRDIFGALADTDDEAGVLLREKPFRYHDEENKRGADGRDHHHQRDEALTQRHHQSPIVNRNQPLKEPLERP